MPDSDVSIRLATTEDLDAIHQFESECFDQTEPIGVALGINEKELRDFNKSITNKCLDNSLSFVAVSRGEIVGIVLCRMQGLPGWAEIIPLDALVGVASGEKITFPIRSKPMDIYRQFIHTLESNYKDLIPGRSEKIMHIEMLCVDKSRYGRQGIGMELTQKSVQNAKRAGCSGVTASATSIASQNLFCKAGFTVLRVLKHDDIVREDGKRIIHCEDGTDEGQLVFKEV